MTEKNENELAVRPAQREFLALTTEVDKGDIVAIAASKYEEQLETAKSSLSQKLEELNCLIKDAEESIKKDCDLIPKQFDSSADRELAKALRQAGYGSYEVAVELNQIEEAGQQVTLTVRLSPKGERYGHDLSREVKAPFAASTRQTLKDLKAARTSAAAVHSRLAEIHRKLANVPQVERKARARLAQAALSRSSEGQALLEQISKVGETSLPQFLLESK